MTNKKVTAIDAIADALGEAIQGLVNGIPCGHLYSMVMGKISLEVYEAAINVLIRTKRVKRSNHYLTWIGPKESK